MPIADTTNGSGGIPQTVTKEELYQPLVCVNALTSTPRFVNSSESTHYSSYHSTSTPKDLAPESEPIKESRLKPDLLGLFSDDAESFEASVRNRDSDTWLLTLSNFLGK